MNTKLFRLAKSIVLLTSLAVGVMGQEEPVEPVYVITGTGTTNVAPFTATKDNEAVDNATGTITNVITAIKDDAGGSPCTIRFGENDDETLDIGTSNITFNGGTDGSNWGLITLWGKITSTTTLGTFTTGTISLAGNVSVNSHADIAHSTTGNTANVNAINNGSTGTLNIIKGTVSIASTNVNANAIYNGSSGIVNITGGTVQATSGSGRAIYNQVNGTVNISRGDVKAMGNGYAVYNDSGMVNISGGTVSTDDGSGVAIYSCSNTTGKGKITISGDETLVTSASSSGTIRLIGVTMFEMSGGTVRNTATTNTTAYVYNAAIYSSTFADVVIRGGEVSAQNAPAIKSAQTGKIIISGKSALITSGNTSNIDGAKGTINIADVNNEPKSGTRLEITDGTVENTANNQNADAIFCFSTMAGMVKISGGKVSATTGRAVVNNSIGKITVSGVAVVTSGNTTYGTIYTDNNAAGNYPGVAIEIIGGTVENSASGFAVYCRNAYDNDIVLGGNPDITSGIRVPTGKLSVITGQSDGTDFAPSEGRTYAVTLADSTEGAVVVSGGAGFLSNFPPVAGTTYKWIPYNNNIVLTSMYGPYSVTQNDGYKFTLANSEVGNPSLTSAINTIWTAANGNDCYIQFGNGGGDALNIGTANIDFAGNLTLGWGKITLSGKITSAHASYTMFLSGTGNSGGLSIESKADITNTGGGNAIRHNFLGELTISDGTVSVTVDGVYAIHNNSAGTINITGGEVSATTGRAIHNNSNGIVNISGGTVRNTATASDEKIIHNQSAGTVNISGGKVQTVNGNADAIYHGSTGAINISGGTVSATGGRAIYNYNNGPVNISGGTVSATGGYVVYNYRTGKITVSDTARLTTTGSTTIYLYGYSAANTSTLLEMTGGTVINGGSGDAIHNYGNGEVNISGGTIEATSSTGRIYNSSGGTLNIYGGTIKTGIISNSSTGGVLITGGIINARVENNSNGTVEIRGGDITSYSNNVVQNNNANGKIIIADSAKIRLIVSNYNARSTDAAIYANNGTVEILGGKIEVTRTPHIRPAVIGQNIVLGGNPDIIGTIKPSAVNGTIKIEVTNSETLFAPQSGRVYTLDLANSNAETTVEVTDGANFSDNFKLAFPYNSTKSGDNLILSLAEPFFDGDGTESSPYIIQTPADLKLLADLVNGYFKDGAFAGKSYKLDDGIDNIDLTEYGKGASFNGGKGWIPIGIMSQYFLRQFNGAFDGNRKTISGLYINDTTLDEGAGLFGYVGGGIIKDMGVMGVNIRGRGTTGAIVGNGGNYTIERCYSTGEISGTNPSYSSGAYYLGGVAGTLGNSGNVINCYSTCNVSGGVYVGGVVGNNRGNLTNCYSTGAVSGSRYVGGVVGDNSGNLTNSIALNPSVTGTGADVGRVAGYGGSLVNNIAFSGMTVKESGEIKTTTSDYTGLDGADTSAYAINIDGTIGGRFVGSPWTTANRKLPGLFGAAVDMPEHLKATLAKAVITLSPNTYTYNGEAKTPTVLVVVGGETLTNGTHYDVGITNNIYAGEASVGIKGISGLILGDSVTAHFTINKAQGGAVGNINLAGSTQNSITISAVSSPNNGQVVEYAINNVNELPTSGWNTALTFGDLLPGTIYHIFARSKENGNYHAGAASRLEVETDEVAVDNNVPVIQPDGQPAERTARTMGAAGATCTLTVTASVGSGGILSYQWYRNTQNINTGWVAIPGPDGTKSSYHAPINVTGTFYYYVEVTNTVNGIKVKSHVAELIVNNSVNAVAPVIETQPADVAIFLGHSHTLEVIVKESPDNKTLSYQWYKINNNNTVNEAISGPDGTKAYYIVSGSAIGTFHYYVIVTNKIEDNGDNGIKTASNTSSTATVTVTANTTVKAAVPEIVTQPVGDTVPINTSYTLTVGVEPPTNGTISYQWYRNNSYSNKGGEAIQNATGSTYSALVDTCKTYYYYVVVTNTIYENGVKKAAESVASNVVRVKDNTPRNFSRIRFISPKSNRDLAGGRPDSIPSNLSVYEIRVMALDQFGYEYTDKSISAQVSVKFGKVTVSKSVKTDVATGTASFGSSQTGAAPGTVLTFVASVAGTSYRDTAQLLITPPVSVSTPERVVPEIKPAEEAAVIAPVNRLTGEFTAGPNPVSKQGGIVNFYRQGKWVAGCELRVYDAAGNVVNKVKITDNAIGAQSRRKVGSWDLKDNKGRLVSDGTYLVRGAVKTSDGKKEKISCIIGVR